MTSRAGLAGRIDLALEDTARLVSRLSRLREQRTLAEAYVDAAALNLHSFYTAIEQSFEAIAREFDGAIPSGPSWHHELLSQMAAELPELRPAVISLATRDCLDEFRGFRHLVRNVYTFNLNGERVAELADRAPRCLDLVREDLTQFSVFLRGLGRTEDA